MTSEISSSMKYKMEAVPYTPDDNLILQTETRNFYHPKSSLVKTSLLIQSMVEDYPRQDVFTIAIPTEQLYLALTFIDTLEVANTPDQLLLLLKGTEYLQIKPYYTKILTLIAKKILRENNYPILNEAITIPDLIKKLENRNFLTGREQDLVMARYAKEERKISYHGGGPRGPTGDQGPKPIEVQEQERYTKDLFRQLRKNRNKAKR